MIGFKIVRSILDKNKSTKLPYFLISNQLYTVKK